MKTLELGELGAQVCMGTEQADLQCVGRKKLGQHIVELTRNASLRNADEWLDEKGKADGYPTIRSLRDKQHEEELADYGHHTSRLPR